MVPDSGRRSGRGDCENTWVRQEAIAEQFEVALRRIRISEKDLAWLVPMLKSNHQEEMDFHKGRVEELQKRQATLVNRIDQIYEDRQNF